MSLISALVLTVILLLVLKRLNKGYRFFNQLPGPKCYPIIGNILDVIRLNQAEVFEFTRKCCAKYGTFRFWSLGIYHIGLSRTKDAAVLLSSTKHTDKSWIYDFLKDFLGTGLLISNGEKWQTRRKILTPTFHFNILQQFAVIFNEESAKTVQTVKDRISQGEAVIDVSELC